MDYGNCLLFFLVVDPTIRMYLYGLMMDGHVIIIHTHLHTPLRQHHHPLTHPYTTPSPHHPIPTPTPALTPTPTPPPPLLINTPHIPINYHTSSLQHVIIAECADCAGATSV